MPSPTRLFAGLLAAVPASLAQSSSTASSASPSCTLSVSSKVPAPSVLAPYEAKLVATNLNKPRGILFDRQGNLLVVQKNAGVVALTFEDNGGSCLAERSRHMVSNDSSLNHGIALNPSQSMLYVSSAEAVYQVPYDPSGARITGNNVTVVANMTTDDHTTRTLLLPRSPGANGTIIVTRGSTSNFDAEAADMGTGHSQIKSFDLNALPQGRPYDFNADGKMLGWGLRNDVGIDEIPQTGALYSVENSADNVQRNDRDIHQNNPAEELNFLGYISPPQGVQQSSNQGGNFGYPTCYTAWDPTEIPDFNGTTGMAFAINQTSSTNNDTFCQSQFIPPRLAFEAHMAPLDIKFNSAGNVAWIAFHGSWNRDPYSGFKVGAVEFNGDEPVAPRDSRTALVDVVSNPDGNSGCSSNKCFRPVAMAFDSMGRLFFSSDTTGEIYVVTRAGQTGTAAGVESSMPSRSGSTTQSPMPSSTPNAAPTTRSAKLVAYGVSILSSVFQFL